MSRTIVKRNDKKAFWGLISVSGGSTTTTFTRMKGFTEMSGSKNAIEYTRRYVDDSFESSDVVGYSPSWSFGFDEYTADTVLADIVGILDDEKVGADAQREIVFVDFSKEPTEGAYPAVKRTFSVIGDSEGDSTDAYNYSGTLRVVGALIKGTAVIATPSSGTADNVSTVTFTAAS